MNLKNSLISVFIFFLSLNSIFPQSQVNPVNQLQINQPLIDNENIAKQNISYHEIASTPEGRVLLASVSTIYPVTPGDNYSLSILGVYKNVSIITTVQNDYTVNLGDLGIIFAEKMKFIDLKKIIENKVKNAYPGSIVELKIVQTGLFQIKIIGEVLESKEIPVWSLQKLSDVIEKELTKYSSRREIYIKNKNGENRKYDLFLSAREGRIEEDPYLQPGDVITIGRIKRLVTLSGSVFRPGKYELLNNEGVYELIDRYGDGFTLSARPDLITIVRSDTNFLNTAGIVHFKYGQNPSPVLIDGDQVFVSDSNDFLPVVYIEGAIYSPDQGKGERSLRLPYRAGETVGRLVKSIFSRIDPKADLYKASIIRAVDASAIPINLEKLIFAYDFSDDIELYPGDRILIPLGAFEVFITGEVQKSTWIETTGLTRLANLIGPYLTPYSSIRDIIITDNFGNEHKYDLFKAERFGIVDENPYVKMGDTITIGRVNRRVSVSGEIERPGTYQLLPEENLIILLNFYGQRLTERADVKRIDLVRYIGGDNPAGNRMVYNLEDGDQELHDRDVVTVRSLQDLLPVMFFEGAINPGEGKVAPEGSNRVVYQFFPGEYLANAVRARRADFNEKSDLANAYLKRGNEKIQVDLTAYLFDKDFRETIVIQPGDILVVPFLQYFVTVGGAVKNPGRFPYVPDRTWRYYVGLAGGIDAERNSGEILELRDRDDALMTKDSIVPPEGKITVETNSFLYYFGRYAPLVTTFLSIAATALGIISAMK
jgi:protein involved in polysaccharide export with SLBB domain